MREYGIGVQGLIAAAASQPCLVCGGAAAFVGVYIAEGDAARRLGAAAGKTRCIFYSLCGEHPPSPAAAEEAERLLEAFCAASPPAVFPVAAVAALTFFEGQ